MERNDLVARLNATAAGLRSLFHGPFESWFDRVVLEQGAFDPGEKPLAADRLYEVLCYLTLVLNLQCDEIALKTSGRNLRLPHKPGKKSNFAYFRVRIGGRDYDLCNGTAIEVDDSSEPPEHPDISLQESPIRGTAGKLIAIWDAKYTSNGSLPKDAIGQMSAWFLAFDIPRPVAGDVLSQACPVTFSVSAVVTNARPARFNSRVQKQCGFGCVFNFDGSRVDLPSVPSRADIGGAP